MSPFNKDNWKLYPESIEFYTKLLNQKVFSVSEKKTAVGISWQGDFENGDYFLIFVSEGNIFAAVSQHELKLSYSLDRIFYHKPIYEMANRLKDHATLQEYVSCASYGFLLTSHLTFDVIMDLLEWQFVNKTVEIYKEIL